MNLNPAGLARFADWARTLPPRPLPRTVIPVPGEYYLSFAGRLADANHLELLELAGALDDPGAVILGPGLRQRHRQERLAAAAGQPLVRIARLYWDDHGDYLRDPGAFGRMLRPACRRCTARRGIAGPGACRLPPHQTLCRRHRLWTGPSARSHAGQLDISQLPEVLRAHRRHVAQLHHHPRQQVEVTVSNATLAIYQALRADTGSRASGSGCNSSPRYLGTGPGRRAQRQPWPTKRRPRPSRRRDRDIPRHPLAHRTQPPGAQHPSPRSVLMVSFVRPGIRPRIDDRVCAGRWALAGPGTASVEVR